MNIVLAFSEKYIDPARSLITSILVNADAEDTFQFLILDGGLSEESKNKLFALKRIRNFNISFVTVDETEIFGLPNPPANHLSIQTYYRLLIPSKFPDLERALYLDTDITVKTSLRKLYCTNFHNHALAGTISVTSAINSARLQLPEGTPYINAGVLLFNCEKWRKENLKEKVFSYLTSSPYEKLLNADQDAINGVLFNDIEYIPQNWNAEIRTDIALPESYLPVVQNPFIKHYVSADKPWNKNTRQDATDYQYYLEVADKQENFIDNYDLSSLEVITTNCFNFPMYTTPGYAWKYTDIVFEEMSALFLRQMAKGIGTFIDIGAHYGFYSILIGRENPNINLLAFEPVPENFEILKRNLSLNQITGHLFNSALSDTDGEFTFQISEQSSQSGFIANPDEPIIKEINVKTNTLDRFKTSISSDAPLLIKMDTEGNELKVLQGMRAILNDFSDVRLLIEFNPACLAANQVDPQQFLVEINNLGFDIFIVRDVELNIEKYSSDTPWNTIMGERTYRNLYCVKKNLSQNIVIFSHSDTLAGAERSLLELSKVLIRKFGTVCTVVVPGNGPLALKLYNAGVPVITCPYGWWCDYVLPSPEQIEARGQNDYKSLIESLPQITAVHPDFILTSSTVIPWGAMCAYMLNKPHIWWIKEYGELDYGFEYFPTFLRALEIIREASNYLVINSDAVRNAYYSDLDAEKCTVAYNTFTTPILSNDNNAYFSIEDSFKIVISGSVIKSKGQDDAIFAARDLIREGYNVELCLIGGYGTPLGRILFEMVKAEHLDNRIHFLGFVDNVYNVIQQADVCLMCSRYEAFGRVTVEAMLLKKPVIGTNTGGTAELIEDGVDGCLYPPRDIKELKNKILYFINHPEHLIIYGEKAFENIQKKLAERPVDDVIHHLGEKMKDQENPNSTLITQYERSLALPIIQQLNIQAEQREAEIQELQSKLAQQTITEEKIQELLSKLTQQTLTEEKNLQLKEDLNKALAEKDLLYSSIESKSASLQALQSELGELRSQYALLLDSIERANQELALYANSTSWRVTRPFRKLFSFISRK